MIPSAGQVGTGHAARELQLAQTEALAWLSEAAEGGGKCY